MAGSVRRESVALVHRALGSSRLDRCSPPGSPFNLLFPIIGPWEYEFYRDRCTRRGKERMRAIEACLAADMSAAAALVAAKDEDIREAATEEHTRPHPRADSGGSVPWPDCPKEDKENNDGSHNFGDEQIRLDPYRVFDSYFHKDGKGAATS